MKGNYAKCICKFHDVVLQPSILNKDHVGHYLVSSGVKSLCIRGNSCDQSTEIPCARLNKGLIVHPFSSLK